MTLAHHSNVTLVPFCLCPSFLYSYLLYFLFSCSASSCWQPFLFISLLPSLFLNPALVPAPLVCSLPSLPGIPARYFLLSISLASWKKPRKQRHLLLYFARKFHFPSLVCCRGQRCGVNWGHTRSTEGLQTRTRPWSCSISAGDYGFFRSCPSQNGLGRGSCLGCGVTLCAPLLTNNYHTSIVPGKHAFLRGSKASCSILLQSLRGPPSSTHQ